MLFFSEFNYRGNHAGTKARNDVESILRQYGAHPINTKILELRDSQTSAIQSNIGSRLGFIRYYLDLLFVRGGTVIIQYPMLAFDAQLDYIRRLARHNRVVFLIHDIQSLRREGHNGLEQEIQLLNLASGLIVHNRFMEQRLKELGIHVSRFYRLDCFDYLFDGAAEHAEGDGIAFAGNLEKSEFLPEMFARNPEMNFHLFGPGGERICVQANTAYHGSFAPDEVPSKLLGKYGLIWDGMTTVSCTGPVGAYTKINNPHKLSLYIAAGMPVIAWSEAAIGEFIHAHGIGITLDRIDSLGEALSGISEETYQNMKKQVCLIRQRVTSGGFLRAILSEIEEDFQK